MLFRSTYINGLLKVTQRPLTVTASGGTKVYDGSELKVQTYTSSGLVNNETLNLRDTIETITINGSRTNVGSSPNAASVSMIRNQDGEDVTACYAISYTDGTLTVTPKPIRIIAGSDTKVYDGTALTKTDGYTSAAAGEGEEGSGLVSGQTLVSVTQDRKSTRLNSSHPTTSRMPSSA